MHTYQPADKLCLTNVSNLLDLEYFCLKMLCVHSKCMGMMHHRLAQKRGILQFSGGIGSLLDYQKQWQPPATRL